MAKSNDRIRDIVLRKNTDDWMVDNSMASDLGKVVEDNLWLTGVDDRAVRQSFVRFGRVVRYWVRVASGYWQCGERCGNRWPVGAWHRRVKVLKKRRLSECITTAHNITPQSTNYELRCLQGGLVEDSSHFTSSAASFLDCFQTYRREGWKQTANDVALHFWRRESSTNYCLATCV